MLGSLARSNRRVLSRVPSRNFALAPAKRGESAFSLLKNLVFPEPIVVPKVPHYGSESLLPTAPTRVTVLPNGIRVATEASLGEMATIGVWVDTGSRYENNNNNGTAHFLEHLAFKGTAKQSQGELERQFENMGAQLNAFTSRETTTYLARCFKKDIDTCTGVLADIVQHPLLSPDAIERERSVILREMEEVDLRFTEIVFDKVHQMAFRGSSLGRSIIGPAENIERLKRDDLLSFIKTHYSGDRMVVSAAGPVDHDQLVKTVAELFKNIPPTVPEGLKASNGGKPFFIGSDIRMREDDMENAHFAFAFESLPWSHPDAFVMPVIVSMLGTYDAQLNPVTGDTAGKLARVVADEQLAKVVMPFNTPYTDTGLFGIYCVADPYKLSELTWQAQEEVTRLCFEVDEEDVRRAVNQVKASMIYGLDGSHTVCEDIGRQMITFGRRLSQKETFDRLDSITAADIKRVATSLFYDRDLVVSAIGPVSKLPDYNRFRRRTYWLRY